MWSMISWVVSSSPASLVALQNCVKKSSPRGAAALGDLAGEEPRHEAVALDPAAHRGARQRHADDADRGGDHVDEGLVDRVRLRPPGDAEERGRGEIEGQRLDRRIEAELRPDREGGDPARDPFVQLAEIVAHRLGLECDRQRLAIGTVMVEVEQHQPAREDAAEDRRPAELAREVLVLVEQHQLVGVGSDQTDVPAAEVVDAVDMAEARDVGGDAGERILEELDRPQQRQRVRLQPRQMSEVAEARLGQVRAGGNESGSPDRRIHRGNSPSADRRYAFRPPGAMAVLSGRS